MRQGGWRARHGTARHGAPNLPLLWFQCKVPFNLGRSEIKTRTKFANEMERDDDDDMFQERAISYSFILYTRTDVYLFIYFYINISKCI